MRRAALAALLVPALAGASDRLAVELLSTEQPADGAFAYERACWRLGADLAGVTVVQPFEHGGARWVRLAVDGNAWAQRCLDALEPGRRGVDGSVTWFDGFAGGLVVPATGEPERIADSVWYDPERTAVEVAVDAALVARIRSGDSEAVEELAGRSAPEGLAVVGALALRPEPAEAVALEAVARRHHHWRVRRGAVETLDPVLAFEALSSAARTDPAWEVRHGAVERLGGLAGAPLAVAGARSDAAAELVRERARADAAWEVRRVALWQLSSGQLAAGDDGFRDALLADAEPRVRAAALEVLTGAGLVDERSQVRALDDPAPEVRAMGAYLLARAPTNETAPRLWAAMRDESRAVRLSASGVLPFVATDGLEADLWTLFSEESERVDAQPDYLARLAEAMGRRPSAALATAVAARLDGQLAPTERRILSRLYARVAPAEALARFEPQLTATDALLRSIAADAVPDTPETRRARLALLEDPDADVRAGAVLGLCRLPEAVLDERRREGLEIAPGGLGFAAAHALSRCGAVEGELPRLDVVLKAGGTEPGEAPGVSWPALAAFGLLLASIVGLRLTAHRG